MNIEICERCGGAKCSECYDGLIPFDGNGVITSWGSHASADLCPSLKSKQQRQTATDCIRRLSELWPIPDRYRDARLTLDEPFASDDLAAAYDRAQRLLAHIAARREPLGFNLVVYGPNGTGKTHLAAAMACDGREAGLSVVFADECEFLNRIRGNFSDRSGERGEECLRAALDADLLILDDVGKARRTDWSAEALWMVFNGRYVARRSCVLTTNLEPAALASDDRWKAIVSRLQEVSTGRAIRLAGKNLRLIEASNIGKGGI